MLNARKWGGFMFRRQDRLLLIGAGMLVVGGALFFFPFHNESPWAEWLIGPALFYLGGPLTIVGAAIHLFGETANTPAPRTR